MSVRLQGFDERKRLARVVARLAGRLETLEVRVDGDVGGDVWREYAELAVALATVMAQIEPGARGELITTAQMAERLGIKPKTLLKHKAAGAVKPALQRGRLIRWRGDEAAR
jgi:hypothetical protein